MRCPHCGEYEIGIVYTECPDPDEPGEFLSFMVCRNCDNGINEHTESECDCPKPRVSVGMEGDKVKVVIQGLSCSVFSILSKDEAHMLMILLDRRLSETSV